MFTKSLIQQQSEKVERDARFQSVLEDFMKEYDIEDSTFGYVNESAKEFVAGYFDIEKEYDTLQEAIQNKKDGDCIRIIDNVKFQLGQVRESLVDCQHKQIIDLSDYQEYNSKN